MFSRVSLLFALALGIGMTCASSSVKAQTNMIPVSNTPAMSGGASAPVTVQINSEVIYQLTIQDNDTWQFQGNPGLVQVADRYMAPVAKAIRSMKGGWQVLLQGVDNTNKGTWNVIGTAVGTPGTYVDVWDLTNPNPNQLLVDPTLTVNQIVKVIPPTPTPPANPPGPNPKPVTSPKPPILPTPIPTPSTELQYIIQHICSILPGTGGVNVSSLQSFAYTGVYTPAVNDAINQLMQAFCNGQIADPDGELASDFIAYEIEWGN